MRGAKALTALAASFALWAAAPAQAADEFEKYGIESASVSLENVQAGAHADTTISFALTEKGGQPYAKTRDIVIKLPPGAVGNPQAVESCGVSDLGNNIFESHCPLSSQIGLTEIKIGSPLNYNFVEPIYNMEPPKSGNIIARLGFFAGIWPAFVNVRIDPHDYSVVASAEGVTSAASLLAASTTIWALPSDHSHDEWRLTPEEAFAGENPVGGIEVAKSKGPFFSNPTDCSLQRAVKFMVRSYQGVGDSESTPYPQIGGCSKLAFAPRFSAIASNPEAFAPSGIDTDLEIPQDENFDSRATSTLRSAVVTLPKGFTVNAAAADGQQACSAEQVGFEENTPAACPDGAKLGAIEADVPALAGILHGSVYLRTPEPGHLFRFWIVTGEQGVFLKLPADIEPNPLTGQLTTIVAGVPALAGLPQVPFSDLKLRVFGGPRAPLATPGCGTYQTHFRFAPWSGNPAVENDTPMEIIGACGKGGFSPGLAAGTLNSAGGQYSAFTMTLTRSDGEPNPQTLAVHLPQGLLAKVAGVPLCSDQQAATGACPQDSQVGTVAVAAGMGGAPLWIPQPGKSPTAVYLAGPYKGGPYSIVSVVPAQAGPFDLGTVVSRAALYIDPETSLATVQTDPLPQILEGVPVSYRAVHVDVARPEFTVNPTSCARKQIQVTVTGADGRVAEPTAAFQATDCAKLPYKPQMKLSLRGSTRRTGHPALKTVITQRPHQANTKELSVVLPASEFIDQAHISNPCTRVQFNADACPKGSILGTVKAFSPLLGVPLTGKVYFRSNGGERELPDIVADVSGAGVRIIQVGFVDSVHKQGSEVSRIRTRFRSFPDAPVSRIEVSLFGGKRGLLVNSQNLCAQRRRAGVHFEGQNGRTRETHPVIGIRCR